METDRLRRARRKVTSTLDDVIDKVEEVAVTLGEEAKKGGGEVRAEIAALPEQLKELRRAVVAAAEPHRPPERYRPYVLLGVLVMIVAAATAIIVRRKRATPNATAPPEPAAAGPAGSGDGERRPRTAEALEQNP